MLIRSYHAPDNVGDNLYWISYTTSLHTIHTAIKTFSSTQKVEKRSLKVIDNNYNHIEGVYECLWIVHWYSMDGKALSMRHKMLLCTKRINLH